MPPDGGDPLCRMPATELAAAIARRDVSPVDAVTATLRRIEEADPGVGAFCTVIADEALAAAGEAERALMRAQESLGPLHGVPFSAKDVLLTRGVRTTFGSRASADNVPQEDAPAVARLRDAGAILVGKTNTPEQGWLGVTQNALFGATRNPHAPDRTAGGSSGGAAAAVAAGMAPVALGSDSGGSVRIPASFCGVLGFKATLGRVPVYPGSYSSALAHVGPITRTVADAALMLDVLGGPDARDPHSLPRMPPLSGGAPALESLRIGWSPQLGDVPAEPDVLAACTAAVERLGGQVEPVELDWPDALATWETLFLGGAAARFPAAERADMDPGLAALLERAAAWPPERHAQACIARLRFAEHVGSWFEDYDVLLTPAVSVAPFELGSRGPGTVAGRPVEQPYGWMTATMPFNLTGQPAASVPCGFTAEGLPVGLQVVGRRLDEAAVVAVATAIEVTAPSSA